ncbi:MAG: outer membrane protein assembly factor BamD [Alphaproteobacteria bacterium]|nr:MAG: outer membrane protein assembly factor BamD [Alphaproteobacteria bacterium]
MQETVGKFGRVAWLACLCLAGMLALSACSSGKEKKFVARDLGALYNMGQDRLAAKRYREAAAFFDEVERQHPYSQWARRAQLMSAYAYYLGNKYDDAILSAERFLSLHPGNKAAPYAYYLIAICHYERIIDVGRDQKITEKALAALQEVVRRFPDTPYAEDAQLKLDLTRDHLAGKEMEIGRFYQNNGQFLAAISRFRTVLERYETTSHTPEALYRLVESYLALGIRDEARKAAAVLGYNYPGSKWYRYCYKLLARHGLAPTGTG